MSKMLDKVRLKIFLCFLKLFEEGCGISVYIEHDGEMIHLSEVIEVIMKMIKENQGEIND